MAAAGKRIELTVAGIVCAGCATDMETVLTSTDGILEAKVRYADGTVAVVYDPEEIGEPEIRRRIERLGMKISTEGA
ncbi:MAG: heavy-metal-associated domain-containing protein [Thermodesulfobacteriota bacterium]